MRLFVPTTVLATVLALSLDLSLMFSLMFSVSACKKDSASQGLPPATEWNAAPSAASDTGNSGLKPGVASGAADPHAGLGLQTGGGADPHAGLGLDIDTSGGGIAAESGLSAPSPTRAIDSSKFLRGTITPTPALAKLIKPEYSVFLSVKRYDPATGLAKPGTTMAVDKLERAALPASFDLGERQAMVSGTAFSGEVLITVHVSQTGDALSKVKGDLIGTARATIPAEGIKIIVDTVIP